MPEVRSTPPNMPPAPVISTTEQIGPREESTIFSSAVPFSPRRKPSTTRATSTEISSATTELPRVASTPYQVASGSTAPAARRKSRPVFMKIRTIGSSRTATTVATFGGSATGSSSPPPKIPPICSRVKGNRFAVMRPQTTPVR